jgi:hypothetical protein
MRPHYPAGSDGFFWLVYEALSYSCMRPNATNACDLKLLVYAAFSY